MTHAKARNVDAACSRTPALCDEAQSCTSGGTAPASTIAAWLVALSAARFIRAPAVLSSKPGSDDDDDSILTSVRTAPASAIKARCMASLQASALRATVALAWSAGVPDVSKCTSSGTATAFATYTLLSRMPAKARNAQAACSRTPARVDAQLSLTSAGTAPASRTSGWLTAWSAARLRIAAAALSCTPTPDVGDDSSCTSGGNAPCSTIKALMAAWSSAKNLSAVAAPSCTPGGAAASSSCTSTGTAPASTIDPLRSASLNAM
eukprot:365412-Chlamydomonas_euryale.AAC.27